MAARKTTPHDISYRRLFGERAMVLDLLRSGHIPAEVLRGLDLTREMVPLNLQHPLLMDYNGGEERKEGDVAYQLQRRGRGAEASGHAFLMLEFQSSIHPRMDVRMMVYAGLIWLQADRQKAHRPEWAEPLGELPSPILPVVIYNGKDVWKGGPSLRGRIALQGNPDLARLQPDMDYLLLDVKRVRLPRKHGDLQSLTDIVFALEQAKDADQIGPILERLLELMGALPEEQQRSLREAFREFTLVVAHAAELKLKPGALESLEDHMLNVVETIKQSRVISHEQGVQEGLQQGVIAYLVMRLGRGLTPKERGRVLQEVHTAEDAGSVYLLSAPEELEAWLSPKAKATKKKP